MSSSSRTSSNTDSSQSEWQKGDLKQNERKKARAYWSKHLKGKLVHPYQEGWIGTVTRHLLVHLATKNQRWHSVLKSKFPDDILKYRRLRTWVFHRAIEELPPNKIIHGHLEPYQASQKLTKKDQGTKSFKVTKSPKSDQVEKVTKSDQVELETESDQSYKIPKKTLLELENTEQRL